jgi:hypothetical protein
MIENIIFYFIFFVKIQKKKDFINKQTNKQTILLEQLTMNKKDVHLSKNVQKTFQLINEKQILNTFEKEKIKKQYFNNLFFFKTIDYGIGAYSNFMPLHIYINYNQVCKKHVYII